MPLYTNPLFGKRSKQTALNSSGSPMSDFQQALYNTRSSETAGAFDNARSRMRERAQAAGFGYDQPMTQAADAGIEQARAKAVGGLRGDVMLESAPLELQAQNMQNQQDELRAKRKGSLFAGLSSIGLKAAKGAVGGWNPAGRAGKIVKGIFG